MAVYNKLVRDNIPDIIRSSGKRCTTQILSQEDYLAKLEEKLGEELAEYLDSRSMEELADLLEVIAAVAAARGCSWEALLQIREAKRLERGGFEEKILLKEVTEKP